MFIFLAFLISFSLVSFGGVLPHSLFLTWMLWVLALACLLVTEVQKSKRLPRDTAILLAAASACILVLNVPTAISVVSGLWAWRAARSSDHVRRFFAFLAVVGFLESLLGLLQQFIWPGWILGYQNARYDRPTGTFINPNHFAGALEMLIPVGLALALLWLRQRRELGKVYMIVFASGLMGLVLVLSMSRGGIFSFVLTAFLMFGILWKRGARKASIVAAGALMLVLAGVVWISLDVVMERYNVVLEENALLKEGRVLVYRDVVRLIELNPWGVGDGTFLDYYRRYQTYRTDMLFDHAHNDYLETVAEWGIPAGGFFWGVLFLCFYRMVKDFFRVQNGDQIVIMFASIGASFSIFVHSLIDFNLQIPSNAMLFFSLIGIGLRHTAMPIFGDSRVTSVTSNPSVISGRFGREMSR